MGEAAANRRATEAELRQQQGTLLPQVRIDAEIGPQRLRRYEPITTDTGWQTGREASVVVRQLLFDGFKSINEMWRQAARVDAAAARVFERSELAALDAAEAYIDVVRYMQLVEMTRRHLQTHRGILSDVRTRFEGGRAGEGDMQQAEERAASAEAVLAEFHQGLDEARAKYRRAVGLEPYNLRFPGRLRGLPASKDEALAVALRHNPTIQAAESDVRAARYGFDATAGDFLPNIALEGRALHGVNTGGIDGKREELTGRIVMSWPIFTGGQTSWRRVEAAERLTENTERHARLQRAAFETLDRAWAARTITSDRAAALTRQVESARRVVSAYKEEYELGQRTLIDLLNAENQLFNAMVSLVSTRGTAVFADYQLLATTGKLLEYLKEPLPAEAEPISMAPLGFKIAPVLMHAPGPGPEPLNVHEPADSGALPIAAERKASVSEIQEIWRQIGALGKESASFPLSRGSGSSLFLPHDNEWPTTTLSFVPEAARAPGAMHGVR